MNWPLIIFTVVLYIVGMVYSIHRMATLYPKFHAGTDQDRRDFLYNVSLFLFLIVMLAVE